MSRRAKITTKDIADTKSHEIDLKAGPMEDIARPDLDDIAVVTGEDVNSPLLNDQIKILAFMEEKVTFVISKTGADDEIDPVDCAVNGEKRIIKRGETVTLPRKFLNALIGSVSTIRTEQYDDELKVQQTKIRKDTNPSMPISIVEDPSGKYGMEWFRFTQLHGG